MITNQQVDFRLIQMPCCGHLLCWVNPRYPSYCPQCGEGCYPQVKGCVTLHDPRASLKLHEPAAERISDAPVLRQVEPPLS